MMTKVRFTDDGVNLDVLSAPIGILPSENALSKSFFFSLWSHFWLRCAKFVPYLWLRVRYLFMHSKIFINFQVSSSSQTEGLNCWIVATQLVTLIIMLPTWVPNVWTRKQTVRIFCYIQVIKTNGIRSCFNLVRWARQGITICKSMSMLPLEVLPLQLSGCSSCSR